MSGLLNNSLFLSTAAAAGGYQVERSLRFNSSDSAYLSRTPGTASNRKTWTWAGWVKRSALGSAQGVFEAGTGSGTDIWAGLLFNSSNQIFLRFLLTLLQMIHIYRQLRFLETALLGIILF